MGREESSSVDVDDRGMRRSALLLLTVVVVVGTCFAPRLFVAVDAIVVGLLVYGWYGRRLRG